MTGLWPTADEVARAIVAAVKVAGLPSYWAELIAMQRVGSMDARRARIYAAVALRETFDDQTTPGGPGNTHFSRMVGDARGGLLTAFDNQLRHQGAYWFDAEKLALVKVAIRQPKERSKLIVVRPTGGYVPSAAELMGDPPPGRSALDKIRGASGNA